MEKEEFENVSLPKMGWSHGDLESLKQAAAQQIHVLLLGWKYTAEQDGSRLTHADVKEMFTAILVEYVNEDERERDE